MSTRITFNGKEYDSPDTMPPEVRQAYERAMELVRKNNGGGIVAPHVNLKFSTNVRFVHDGKTYDSVDQMPPEVREKYAAAMQQIDKNQNGIPDFLEDTGETSTGLDSGDLPSREFSAPIAPLSAQPPVIEPERSTAQPLLIAGLIILVLVLVVFGLVLYIFQH